MKTNKLSISMKFIIPVIAVILAAIAVFGFANIQAEPTIEDLAKPYVQQMGEFKPSSLYSDKDATIDDMNIVSILNTTQIIFDYDLWGNTEDDKNNDGIFDSQDVYLTDGFEQGMLMYTGLYHIFEINKSDNYYIVPLMELDRYNGVIIELVLAENNDLAKLIDESKYWFDTDSKLLYIDKSVLTDSINEEIFNSLRIETIMLVKDTADMTKTIDLFASFNKDVSNWHGLDKKVVNETRDVNVLNWSLSGLKYQLVDESMLAYVSANNLSVYYNFVEMPNTEWSYNELTGEITIDCDVAKTTSIIVEFKDINDVSLTESVLQYCQTASDDIVVKADSVSIMSALKSNNQFLDYLQYDEAAPQVGDWQELGYFCYIVIDESGGFTANAETDIQRMKSGIIQYDFNAKVPLDTVAREVYYWAEPIHKSKEYTQSATLTAYSDGYSWKYGEIVSKMFDASKGDMSSLEQALALSEAHLFTNVNTGNKADDLWDHALTSLWMMSDADNNGNSDEGRYVTGIADDYLLGGTIPEDSNAMFDVICARIIAPNAEAVKEMENKFGDYSSTSDTDFRSNVTIIAKTEEKVLAGDGSTADGYLYLCLWAQSLASTEEHTQRVLAFSRVPYKYHGTGYVELTKFNEDGAVVPGATYSIYKIENDGTKTKYPDIVTDEVAVKTGELPMGTYEIKEITSPEGYLLNSTTYTVTVESGLTTVLNAEDGFVDPYQMCDFTMTVYDATTKGSGHEVPLQGITFQLYSVENGLLNEFTTDANGKISGSVKTIVSGSTDSYYLKQINTIKNYAMTTDSSSWLYCWEIPISAPATTSGKNTSTSIVHYEARQTIDLMSQVQDINLGEKTPATLGGDTSGGALVSTLSAQYNLKTKETILLGYKNGSAVTVPAGTVLTLATYLPNGTEGNGAQATSVDIDKVDKAYIYAKGIVYGGITYPVPNGTYEWVLTKASSGYYMNGQITAIDASWSESNWEKTTVQVHDVPVKQTRQTGTVILLAKSYDDDNRNLITGSSSSGYATVVKDKVPSLSQMLGNAYAKTYKSIFTKTELSKNSADKAVGYYGDSVKIVIESNSLAPNFVYALYSAYDIVDINSGETFKGIASGWGEPLGFYLTNGESEITITTFGTKEFDNPNSESNESMPVIGKCDPKTINGTSMYGHSIPNGVYYLAPYLPADGYMIENIISEDSTYDGLKWFEQYANKQNLIDTCAVYVWDIIKDHEIKPIVAPDAPIEDKTETDPQDPAPERVGIEDDGSKVDNEWVDNNSHNVAYRIFDSENMEGDVFEVSDNLPTTFAFYGKNTTYKDPLYDYTYHLSIFYEIEKSEYEKLKDDEKFVYEGTYYRRFDTNSLTEAEKLSNVIKFNSAHFDGYISDVEILDNSTVAGMLYNTEWLNEKMREQEDGCYKILFQIKISYSYNSKFSNDPITVHMNDTWNGVLTIKNRQLVNLD